MLSLAYIQAYIDFRHWHSEMDAAMHRNDWDTYRHAERKMQEADLVMRAELR